MPIPFYEMANKNFAETGLTDAQYQNILKAQDTLKTANIYGSQAGTEKSREMSGAVSTLSSTEGQNTYDKTVGATLTQQQQQGTTATAAKPPTLEDTLLQNEINASKTEEEKKAEAKKAEINTAFAPILAENNAILNQQIATINSQYGQLVRKQEEANTQRVRLEETIGIRTGAARYTADTAGDLVQEQISIGLAKIGELNAKRQNAISEMQAANRKDNMTLAFKQFELLQKATDDRDAAISDLDKEIRVQIVKQEEQKKKDAETFYTQFTKPKNDIMIDAAKNLAPQEVLNAIDKSDNLAKAVKAAGEYLQSGSGVVSEYLAYKRDAQARNLPVLSFDEYQTRDANRKLALAKAVNAGGLTSQENQTFMSITTKYQADSIINASIKGEQIRTLADQIIAHPEKATNQLASLYLYVKNLDPDSAVREGELALANTTQSYLQRFNNSLTRLEKGQVIAPKAASELAEATKALVATWEKTAQKKTQFYKSQANNSSPNVGASFNKYLSDIEGTQDTSKDINQTEEETKNIIIEYGRINSENQEAIKKMVADGIPYSKIKKALGI